MLAAVAVRMRSILVVIILGAASLSLADERPRLRGAETPRATDLLHAKRLADRMEGRLRTPAAHGTGWRQGGSGWESQSEPPAPPAPVTIQIRQPRRRRTGGVSDP